MSNKLLDSKMSELTREAVLKAIDEFNALNREGFLEKYKFGRAQKWFIHHERRTYDVKAIAGVAHKFLGSGIRYLEVDEFKTGKGSKAFGKLESLGFVIKQDNVRSVAEIAPEDAILEPYNPSNFEDARKKTLREIRERRGQQNFRKSLLNAYGNRCAISACSIIDVLESAHICPYRGPDTNKVWNGILLRADLHTLFDCGLIAINHETMRVRISPLLTESEYWCFHNQRLNLPQKTADRPSREALKERERNLPFRWS